MRRTDETRRILIGVWLVASVLLTLAGLGLARSFLLWQDAADYPGATVVSGDSRYKFWPRPVLRRDTAYQSTDTFNDIYNFYSTGFSLGPERYAQGTCSLMANSTTLAGFIEHEMSVMLCDTSEGRTILVTRIIVLRFR